MEPSDPTFSRRDMLKKTAVITGLAAGPFAGGHLSGKEKGMASTVTRPGNDRSFPYLEFSADTYFDLGKTIGRTFSSRIRKGIERRKDWIEKLKAFVQANPAARCQVFIEALKKHFPHLLEELKGMAEGSGVPFMDLMALNLNPELGMMMRKPVSEPDCSTVIAKTGDRVVLAHNEDGSSAYSDLMYMVRVRAPGGITFLCMSYPGIIAGNGPGINDRGIAHTCNFIAANELEKGVPRYFLDRAMLEAKDIEDAVGFATHPERSYSQNHNILSFSEKRALMIETSPSKYRIMEVEGMAFHANHFVLEGMEGVPESALYVAGSTPRYNIVKEEAEKTIAHRSSPEPEELVKVLSCHRGKPFAPCRHPSKIGGGCTLGTVVFDTSVNSIQVFKGNPCEGRHVTYDI